MEHSITVIGIGPGHPEYVLPVAASLIREARILAGSRRVLETFAELRHETRIVDGDIATFMNWLRDAIRRDEIVVLVSGDPGYFSLLDALRREFSAEAIRVIPGVSSYQVAFARIGLPWHDAVLLSFHGREPGEETLQYQPGRLLSILTDGTNHPAVIAEKLLVRGWLATTVTWLCRDLSYETETIVHSTLSEVLSIDGFESCVMVVKG